MSAMKTTFCRKSWWLGVLLGCCWSPPIEAQGVIGASLPSETIKWHNSLAKDFKAGRTNNVPLLHMDWFSDPSRSSPGYYTVHWFSVSPSGSASTGVSSISNGARHYTLNKSNLLVLLEAVGKLPEPPTETLAYKRQIVISGIRSNEWFHAVYDRGRIPKEVMEVYRQSRAHLDAYMH